MPIPVFRYELDITGINPDNLVQGERHTLSTKQIRSFSPVNGPFFAAGAKVYDFTTGRLLVRGIDYQFVELLQDATLQYGKEIMQIVLIINSQVSSEIAFDHQLLGGYFSNTTDAVVNMYETVMNDQRPIKWENVLNKPIDYPSTLHRHLLADIYGFEPVVAALERIYNALLLTDIPVFELVLDEVNKRINTITTREVMLNIPNKKSMSYTATLVLLTRMFYLSNYRFGELPVMVREGTGFQVEVQTQNVPNGTSFYWEIINDGARYIDTGTNNDDHLVINGTATINNNQARFFIEPFNDNIGEVLETFMVGLKYSSTDVDYMAVSPEVRVVNEIPGQNLVSGYNLFFSPDIESYQGYAIDGFSSYLSEDKDWDSRIAMFL